MKNVSSTMHALLGLLGIKPMSGYDIRQMIPETIGHFWSESYGQIYPALKTMVEEGLVAKRTDVQEGKPERHVYTLTVDGRERLREWLGAPVGREVVRNELLLKLFFGAHAAAAVSREHVTRFLEEQRRELGMFEGISQHLRERFSGDPQQPFWLITLSRGEHDARAAIAWAKETLAVLESLGTAELAGPVAVNAGETMGEEIRHGA